MCTLLNINSQTPSDLRQGQSTCNDPLRLRRLLSAKPTFSLLYPCHGDSGGRAGCVTKPYKNYTVQILESELGLTHFCKAEANEIDFGPGHFRYY